MKEKINILVTVDENYIPPLEVMLYSLYTNNKEENVHVWLIHEKIPQDKLDGLSALLNKLNWDFTALPVEGDFFKGAPTVERYPKEMYYRLLCAQILPNDLDKILYLDPDILIINSIRELWEFDMAGKMIAAATHKGITNIMSGINNIRLGTDHGYYNSGIMIFDLNVAREIVKLDDINDAINKFSKLLLLPDQDILNFLYGNQIIEIDEEIWNYDARKYTSYLARSLGKHDIHWVMDNTAILHFCGKPKPWEADNDTKFTALYLNYKNLLEQL